MNSQCIPETYSHSQTLMDILALSCDNTVLIQLWLSAKGQRAMLESHSLSSTHVGRIK